MIAQDLTTVTFDDLLAHLQQSEECKVTAEVEPFGFTLLFTPKASKTSAISNIGTIAEWAKLNNYSLVATYREPVKSISLSLISVNPY